MTTKIIYHDFQNNHSLSSGEPATGVCLTAAVLAKGRRLAALNRGLNVACITLCGACIGVGVLILANLILG